ncbi:MAG: alpha/beta hydrolase [Nitrososphaerales archaeon]|nr:alpha/beta hydrolase [Nitrososphaerales archaeon]
MYWFEYWDKPSAYDSDNLNLITGLEVQDHFRMTDGFGLFYRHWKTTGEVKRIVVCIHGIGEHSGFFRFVAQDLASDGAEVFAIDLRGFGNSREEGLPIGDTSNIKKYLHDVEEVITYIRGRHPGKKLFLIGHSMGGLHALWYAANNPSSPDGLILAGSSVDLFGIRAERPSARLLIRAVFQILFARRAMLDMYGSGSERFRRSQEFDAYTEYLINDPLSTGKFTWRYLLGIGPLVRKALKNASRTYVPAFIIQGEADGMVGPTGARKVFEELASKDKILRTFADADHYFYHVIFPTATSKYDLGKKKQVTNAISDWLRTH